MLNYWAKNYTTDRIWVKLRIEFWEKLCNLMWSWFWRMLMETCYINSRAKNPSLTKSLIWKYFFENIWQLKKGEVQVSTLPSRSELEFRKIPTMFFFQMIIFMKFLMHVHYLNIERIDFFFFIRLQQANKT